jgi:hypothetical protein
MRTKKEDFDETLKGTEVFSGFQIIMSYSHEVTVLARNGSVAPPHQSASGSSLCPSLAWIPCYVDLGSSTVSIPHRAPGTEWGCGDHVGLCIVVCISRKPQQSCMTHKRDGL